MKDQLDRLEKKLDLIINQSEKRDFGKTGKTPN